MNQSELLDAREAARKKVVLDLQERKEPEEDDAVFRMLKLLASEAAGKGFDEGVRFMESSKNSHE